MTSQIKRLHHWRPTTRLHTTQTLHATKRRALGIEIEDSSLGARIFLPFRWCSVQYSFLLVVVLDSRFQLAAVFVHFVHIRKWAKEWRSRHYAKSLKDFYQDTSLTRRISGTRRVQFRSSCSEIGEYWPAKETTRFVNDCGLSPTWLSWQKSIGEVTFVRLKNHVLARECINKVETSKTYRWSSLMQHLVIFSYLL